MAIINGLSHFNGILTANQCLYNVHVVVIIARALEILRKGRYLRLHSDTNRNLACRTFLYIEYIKAIRIYIYDFDSRQKSYTITYLRLAYHIVYFICENLSQYLLKSYLLRSTDI